MFNLVRNRTILSGACLFLAPFAGAALGLAQTPPPRLVIPSSSGPPLGSPLPGIAPAPSTRVAPALPAAPPVAPATVDTYQIFSITDAQITGATAFTQAELAPYLAGLTGPAVGLDRIEAARAALLTRYRRAGFSYSTVRVRIRGQTLRINVVEPHVTDVKLSQDIGPAGTMVLRFLNHLSDGRLLSDLDLERWVLLANDVPGITVHAVLEPSATNPGAFVLRALVERAAVTGSVRADNRAFRQTGPEELLATADLNSFTSWGDRTEISLYHTFNNTDTFGQASEDFFIGASGLKLHVYGGAGESIPSGSLRELGYDGVTRVFGATLSYPAIRSRAQTLMLSAIFDGVESEINYGVLGHNTRASFDSLRVLRLDASDTLSDLWATSIFAGAATDTSGLTISQGLPAFGASSNGARELPRLNERVDFTKVQGRLDRIQPLFSPFFYQGQNSEVQVELAVQGQFTNNIMPPEEKFYLGGPNFDRGFYYGEVTGDRALEAKVEPQLVTSLPTVPYTKIIPQATFYAFYDWGETWEQQRTDLGHILRSIGGGVRMTIGDHAEIDLEGVSRLTKTPTSSGGSGDRLKSSAVYWQVVGRF
jgi:hemolysin activation/secretion protein